jgi:hypothetical protein
MFDEMGNWDDECEYLDEARDGFCRQVADHVYAVLERRLATCVT